jgi:hypothetical protein
VQKTSKYALSSPFRGKEAHVNRLIFEVLRAKKQLTSYEIFQELHNMKGNRHIKNQVVDRRMEKLHQQSWIIQRGTKRNKLGEDSPLYELSQGGHTALESDKVNMYQFVLEASDELQVKMQQLLSSFREDQQKRKDKRGR